MGESGSLGCEKAASSMLVSVMERNDAVDDDGM